MPIAFPPGELIAIGDGSEVVFASTDSPETATRRRGHDDPVKRIAVGGGLIASVSCWFQDTRVDEVRLWTAHGQHLGPVALPENVADIVSAPDGRMLVALGHSGALWQVTLTAEDWIDTARRIAGRGLTAEEQRRYGVDAWRARATRAAE